MRTDAETMLEKGIAEKKKEIKELEDLMSTLKKDKKELSKAFRTLKNINMESIEVTTLIDSNRKNINNYYMRIRRVRKEILGLKKAYKIINRVELGPALTKLHEASARIEEEKRKQASLEAKKGTEV